MARTDDQIWITVVRSGEHFLLLHEKYHSIACNTCLCTIQDIYIFSTACCGVFFNLNKCSGFVPVDTVVKALLESRRHGASEIMPQACLLCKLMKSSLLQASRYPAVPRPGSGNSVKITKVICGYEMSLKGVRIFSESTTSP